MKKNISQFGRLNLILIGILLLLTLLTPKCTCLVGDHDHPEPSLGDKLSPNKPEIHAYSFEPAYFCSGQKIAFSWDTENFKKIQLLDKDDYLLYETRLASGTAQTNIPVHREMLHLKLKCFWKDNVYEGSSEDYLFNIDNPTWTGPISSAEELQVPDSRRLEHAYDLIGQNSEGLTTTVPVYKIYRTYEGFRWNLYDAGISIKAMVEAIENNTDNALEFIFEPTGLRTKAEINQREELPNRVVPYVLYGYYSEPIEEHVGYQYDDITKPETEFFNIDEFRQTKTALIKLRVVCMDE